GAAIHHAGDRAFGDFFTLDFGRSPYLLFYLLSHALAFLVDVETATRLVTVIGVAGLPLALAAYLHANDRPALYGALGAGIALNAWVFWGFVPYALGVTLALFSLAALAEAIRAPSWQRLAFFGGLAVATFYAHPQAYVWLVAASVIQAAATVPALGFRRTLYGALRAFVAAFPSAVAVWFWLARSGFAASGEASGRNELARLVAAESARFAPLEETLRRWLAHSFAVYRDGSGERLAVYFLGVVLLLVVLRAIETRVPVEEARFGNLPAPPGTAAPELVLALTVAAYFFAPVAYKLVEPISHRFLPVALALLAVLGPVELRRRRLAGWLAGLALLALSLETARVHLAHFERTDSEMGELEDALARTKPGGRLLGLVFDRGSEVVGPPIYLHAHAYYQARAGGLACYSFAELPKSPVRFRPGAEPPPFPPRFEWTPEAFDADLHGKSFDYFLVRTRAGQPAPRLFPPDHPGSPRVLFEGPRWKLYAKAAATANR
ncbi:MAG TPA: hypothetical protein VFF17_05660, partial [Thermoanaerobaculia bacterium]|nr:hypothetical protein [Thermoanaerobaculia bacterium]